MQLNLGTNLEDETQFSISCERTQRILVCGKTGTGKSYTLGVILEELNRETDHTVLVMDPQGIYWTMVGPNTAADEADLLWQYDLAARGFAVNLLVPGDPVERYGGSDIVTAMEQRGLNIQELRLNPADLSPERWLELFGLDINELSGIMLFKAVRKCKHDMGLDFNLDDLSHAVSKTAGADATREAVLRRIDMAHDWQLFQNAGYRQIDAILQPQAINILDLSCIEQGRYGLRNLVVSVFTSFIFKKLTQAARRRALGLESDLHRVWLAIDEAHNFCPSGRGTLSKEILVRCAKEGRQPGLSLLVASQQPAAIDAEILTQCGIRVVHRITAKDDYQAVNALSQDFVGENLQARIKGLKKAGEALVIDDERETVIPMRVRPRQSFHGGG